MSGYVDGDRWPNPEGLVPQEQGAGALEAVPKGWLSGGLVVESKGQPVADISGKWWPNTAVITIDDVRFDVSCKGFLHWTYELRTEDVLVASATSRGWFRTVFDIRHGEEEYELSFASGWGSVFQLKSGSRHLGELSMKKWFSQRVQIDLDPMLPLPLRLFVLWVAVSIWRAQAAAAS